MSKEKVARFNRQQYVVGLKETLKALHKGRVSTLIIAEDVEVHILTRVLCFINHNDLPIEFFESKQALGAYVGINVKASIVAILDLN